MLYNGDYVKYDIGILYPIERFHRIYNHFVYQRLKMDCV